MMSGRPPGSAARSLPLLLVAAAAVTASAAPPSQVNVSASGTNIRGDAGNEPSIAVDPNDGRRIAIGWRQFDSVLSSFREAGYAWSDDGGRTWHNDGPLTNGTFRSDPVLESRADGTFIYHSLQGNFVCDTFLSNDGGATWAGPTFAFGGDKAWIVADRTGGEGLNNVYAAWSTAAGPYSATTFCRSIDGAQSWETPVAMPLPVRWGTLSVAPTGDLYVAGIQSAPFDVSRIYCVRSATAKMKSVTPSFDPAILVDLGGPLRFSTGPNPAGLLGQVTVEAGADGVVYLLASIDPPAARGVNDPLDVHLCRSLDGGFTWSAPVRVNADPPGPNNWNWMATMSLAPNGRIDVVYLSTHESGAANISRLYVTQSVDQGSTWSPPVALTPPFDSFVGWPQQNKMGDYFHMRSDLLGANLAYCSTVNGEQDVWFARIGPRDCNGDGIPDACGSDDADFNADGTVDGADLALLLAAWNTSNGDLTGDGTTTGDDLAVLLGQWGY
ncbi:MAG: hypothetical protein JNM94_05700 [Phycisphaerae bacterium]|nr:hypothetical protein [Phycisphaerae bacterium]